MVPLWMLVQAQSGSVFTQFQLCQRQIYSRYGLEISAGADIDDGLYIAHLIGTVISVKRMGRNCSIIAAVTIGMRNE
jgi:serine O-acetyltransferase